MLRRPPAQKGPVRGLMLSCHSREILTHLPVELVFPTGIRWERQQGAEATAGPRSQPVLLPLLHTALVKAP